MPSLFEAHGSSLILVSRPSASNKIRAICLYFKLRSKQGTDLTSVRPLLLQESS